VSVHDTQQRIVYAQFFHSMGRLVAIELVHRSIN
jgi:hypothetical protein